MSKKLIRANNAYACSDCIAFPWLTRLGEPKWSSSSQEDDQAERVTHLTGRTFGSHVACVAWQTN